MVWVAELRGGWVPWAPQARGAAYVPISLVGRPPHVSENLFPIRWLEGLLPPRFPPHPPFLLLCLCDFPDTLPSSASSPPNLIGSTYGIVTVASTAFVTSCA